MSSQHEDAGIRIALAERAPGFLRLRQVHIKVVVPFGIAALNRMMHQVAGNHRILALGRDSNGKVARRVSGSRLEPYFVSDLALVVHQVRPPFRE